jgi:hypothetical protein
LTTGKILRAFLGGRSFVIEQSGQKSAGSGLDQIERVIEAFALAKKGVGNVLVGDMGGIVQEAADLVAR